jgi:hypothetical protein
MEMLCSSSKLRTPLMHFPTFHADGRGSTDTETYRTSIGRNNREDDIPFDHDFFAHTPRENQHGHPSLKLFGALPAAAWARSPQPEPFALAER